MPYANNKGADQPVHPRNLISAFIVRFLDSIIATDVRSKISRLLLASVAEQTGLSVTWLHTFENRFSRDGAHTLSSNLHLICFAVPTTSEFYKLYEHD